MVAVTPGQMDTATATLAWQQNASKGIWFLRHSAKSDQLALTEACDPAKTRTATPNRKSTTNAPSSTRKHKGVVDRTSGRSSPVVSMRSPSNKALTVTRRLLWLDNGSPKNGTARYSGAPNGTQLTQMSALGQKRTSEHIQSMSAFGTKRTWQRRWVMSAFGGKADIDWMCSDVRF